MSRFSKWLFWVMSWCVGQMLIGHFTNDVFTAMSFFGLWVMLFDRLTN